jgi:cell division inhibitor SepF
MTTMHRVKAYFGMVPADELDSYDGYDDDRRYDGRRDDRGYGTDRYGAARYADRYEADRYEGERRDVRDARHDRYERSDDRYESDRGEYRSRTPRPRDPEVAEIRRDEAERTDHADQGSRAAARGRSWASTTGPQATSVRAGATRTPPSLASASSGSTGTTGGTAAPTTRGSLAVEPEPVAAAATPSTARKEADPASAPSEITSLQPKSYNEARVIGERYREGIPVIMNLTEMDDAGAKRLVDFAAGLAFALRGSIEKVTNRVFLLSPPNVEVSAAERRKLAEKGFGTSS